MKKLFKNRYFVASFFFTLIIIFFTTALLYVDNVSRATMLGSNEPSFSLLKNGDSTLLSVNAFGINKTYDVSLFYTIIKAICDFICIPV